MQLWSLTKLNIVNVNYTDITLIYCRGGTGDGGRRGPNFLSFPQFTRNRNQQQQQRAPPPIGCFVKPQKITIHLFVCWKLCSVFSV